MPLWRNLGTGALVLALTTGVAACATGGSSAEDPGSGAVSVAAPVLALSGLDIAVSSTESCSCCKEWVAYLEELGATVEVTYVEDLAGVKDDAGVPSALRSCHTAFVDGYVIEGHVPAEAILELVQDGMAVDGIALPGMPSGSPGMPGDTVAPLEVSAFVDGDVGPFGDY